MPAHRLSLRIQLLLGFGVVLLLSASVSVLAYRNTLSEDDAAQWVLHTEDVIGAAEAVQITVDSLDAGYREYMLSGAGSDLAAYQAAAQAYRPQLDALAVLTADNPPQVARWQTIASQTDALRTQLDGAVATRQQNGAEGPAGQQLTDFDEEAQQISAIGGQLTAATDVERTLLSERAQAAASANQFLLHVLVWGTLATVVAGLVVAALVAHTIGSAMAQLSSVAQAIAAGDLSRRIKLQRHDEVGRAAAAFDRMADTLQKDRAELLAMQRMKDEFISTVSHELRTPLTSIRGSLGLLQAGMLGPMPPKAAHMLEVALTNTDRLIRLINDILDIERIESGRTSLDLRSVNIRELVLRSIENLKSLSDGASVRIVAHVEPMQLLVDPDRLVQTLTNLISNAIKFSLPASTIDVTVERDPTGVLFSVRDQGRGIPPDKLESIFGRFEQVEASDAREKGGTGLGLAIARSIVEQHGGRIWAESVMGQGSTFRFTIPSRSQASASEIVPTNADQAGPRILVVDDDAHILDVICGMLVQQGYRPLSVRSGRDAIATAVAEQPAAVLLDLAMPETDGWQTLCVLKDTPGTRDIPVIVLSALERNEHMPVAMTAGWIAKPVLPEALHDVLERVLALRPAPR